MRITLLVLLFVIMPYKTEAGANYEYLLSIINNELGEVARLNKQIQATDPQLLLRMSELYLERGRVKKEQENERFLSIPPKKRRSINKKKFFKKSKSDITQAYKVGGFILKKFPKTKVRGDVFYILAFYAQEFQGLRKAKKLFSLAKKYSEKNSSSFKKSSLALADIYYNEKNFKSAISNYENAIDDKDSKWWTRDAFNLAWCYFREGAESKGINLMKEVHRLSKKGFYLNFQNDAERDLAYFFAESGRIKEADRFIRSNGASPSQFLQLAKNLIDQGKKSKAIQYLLKAKSSLNNQDAMRFEINNLLLNQYEKFGEYEKHLIIAQEQNESRKRKLLDTTTLENLKFQVKKMASSIQEKIKSKRYDGKKSYLIKLADIHLGYTSIIIELLPKKRSDHLFFQAEIDYAVGNTNRAAKGYYEALNDKTRRFKHVFILKNLLACLSGIGADSEFYKKNAQKIYELYIKHEKKLALKKPVYPLLFSIYLKSKNIVSAEKILNGYNKYFKKDMKTIESMLANILDIDVIKNDKARFLSFVKRINNKEFVISRKLAAAIKNNALSLQFKGVQESSSTGKKASALRGYKLIYEDPLSTSEARKNAAFNMAVLYYDLKYPKKTAKWTLKAIALMGKNDLGKMFKTLRRLSVDLYNFGNEDEALKIMIKLGNGICKDGPEYRNLLTDYFNFYLLNSASPRFSTAKFYKKCVKDPKFYSKLKIKSYDYFLGAGDVQFVLNDLNKSLKNKKIFMREELRAAKLIALHYYSSRSKVADRLVELTIRKYKKNFSADINFKELQAIQRLRKIETTSKSMFKRSLKFPENVFNSRLKKRLNDIGGLAKLVYDSSSKGGVVLIGLMYEKLILSYERLIAEISNFSPPKKSQEYVVGFKKSMSNLSENLKKQSSEVRKTYKKIVIKKELLTLQNYDLLNSFDRTDFPRISSDQWVIMDRGN